MRFLIGLLVGAVLVLAPFKAAAQLKVAVLDTGLSLTDPRFSGLLCESGHKDFTGKGITDRHGHGTHIAGLIKRNAGDTDYCLLIVKFYDDTAPGFVQVKRYLAAIRYVIEQHADIVNLSGGGPEFQEDEYLMIRDAKNVTFVVAAGNDGLDIDSPGAGYFPASYGLSNVKAVGSVNRKGERSVFSNWGKTVQLWELGERVESDGIGQGNDLEVETGTSQATAIATGKLIYKFRRITHPKSRQ